MKRLLLLILTFVLSFGIAVSISCAADKTVRLTWQQNITPDFLKWEVYYGTAAGGPYDYLTTIMYDSEQNEYTSDEVIVAPDGQETTYYFVLISWDNSDNPSGYSNEASVLIDLEAPPAAFSLEVVVVPGP